MEESVIHKILIVENNEDLSLKIKNILSSEGFEVQCVSSADDAFKCLEKSLDQPFAVIISGYQMPKMRGDKILEKAKDYSPRTRRMLLAHAGDMEIVINAINIAEIQGCLSLPFKSRELISQIHERCREFEAIEKKSLLKKITGIQNKQLYRIALNFKNKEKTFIRQIETKKKKIRVLKAQISIKKDQHTESAYADLEKFLDRTHTSPSPENFSIKFIEIKEEIKKLLKKIISSKSNNLSYDSIKLDTDYEFDTDSKHKQAKFDSEHSRHKQEHEPKPEDSSRHPVIDTIIRFALISLESSHISADSEQESKASHQKQADSLDDYLELIIDENKFSALISIKKPLPDKITAEIIEEYLRVNGITFGIKDDKLIGIWLANATIKDAPFVIAEGIKPEFPNDAEVKYYFPTDFKKAGKILPDGSIDFKDRGDIPFVAKDSLLAEKTMAVQGKEGVDIFGEEIPIASPKDIPLLCGTGTRFSEDKLKVFADSDGMPHMDAMGKISVLSEIVIPEDVDYKTGNLDFDGNIVVKGIVKAGFSIKCANLTIKQIEGAEIDLSGDLNVTAGIVDAHLIKVQGNIQAKYMNNSIIKAFGDVIIQKEIIDSKLLLSGACINETGHIISSYISAKQGVSAGSIGTEVSLHSTIKAGHDEHVEFFLKQSDTQLNKNTETIKSIQNELNTLADENHELNIKISELAFIQDRSQVKLRDIQKNLKTLNESQDMTELKNTSHTVSELRKKIKQAGKDLDRAFIRQDHIMEQMEEKEEAIKKYEAKNKKLLQFKKDLKQFSARIEPVAEVKVKKTIMPGTIIIGPRSSTRIQEKRSRCRIAEIEMKEDDNTQAVYYKMEITDL